MEQFKLCKSEYKFATIIWEYEPLKSGELVNLTLQKLGWKKSTTYTVLKNLCGKGIFVNNNTIITSIIKKEQVQTYESEQFIKYTFDGSLPKFITAFMNDKTLSENEATQLKQLIDQYTEEC